MTLVSAPAKLLLIGENVLFGGGSALSIALDLRLKVEVKPAEMYIVDGFKMTGSRHPYTMQAIDRLWDEDKPLEFTITSNIPSGLGLGSSTALTVATVAALLEGKEDVTPERIASESFEIENTVQGSANPLDSTVVSNGAAILGSDEPKKVRAMWRIHAKERDWHFFNVKVPDIILVLGIAPRKAKSSEAIDKVERFRAKSGFAKDIIKELGALTEPAVSAFEDTDLEKLGYFMDKSHKLLNILGLNTPQLEKMVNAARRNSYGAKLSASSGGNCMIALTDKPEETAAAIESAGGRTLITKLSKTGVRVV